MAFEIVWEPKGAVKRFFGRVSDEEVLQAGLEIEADQRFDHLSYVINDFLACDGFSATPGTVDEISAIDNAAALSNSRIRIAVVATVPEIVAVAEQYAASPMNVYPTRIFASPADARKWLGDSGSTA